MHIRMVMTHRKNFFIGGIIDINYLSLKLHEKYIFTTLKRYRSFLHLNLKNTTIFTNNIILALMRTFLDYLKITCVDNVLTYSFELFLWLSSFISNGYSFLTKLHYFISQFHFFHVCYWISYWQCRSFKTNKEKKTLLESAKAVAHDILTLPCFLAI